MLKLFNFRLHPEARVDMDMAHKLLLFHRRCKFRRSVVCCGLECPTFNSSGK